MTDENDLLYPFQKNLLKWAREQREKRTPAKVYRKFLIEEEYVKSFEDRGESVPPFLCFQPYVERGGVKGYMVLCSPDDPNAELQDEN